MERYSGITARKIAALYNWRWIEQFYEEPISKPLSLEDKIDERQKEEPWRIRDERFLTDVRDSHDKGWEGLPAQDERGLAPGLGF